MKGYRTYLGAFLSLLLSQSSFATPGLFFNVTSSGLDLSIRTTPNHFYPAAGIRIDTPGISLAAPGGDCVLNSNGFCLFPVSNTAPATIKLTGNTSPVNLTLCLNGTAHVTCQKYTVALTVLPYAYITNNVAAPGAFVSKCLFDANNNLTGCVPTATGVLAGPANIIFNPAGTLAYITNTGRGDVTKCSINLNGDLTCCAQAVAAFANPTGITFNRAGTFAYVVDTFIEDVSICMVDASGNLVNCSVTVTGLSLPSGIALNPAGTTAYIANFNNGRVTQCTVNQATGLLSGCVTAATGFSLPLGITINPTGTYAYVASAGTNTVRSCTIDSSTGNLTGCVTNAFPTNLNAPAYLAINAAGTLIYVTNQTGNNVSKCDINPINGTLLGCFNSGNGMQSPSGIALH